MKIIRPAQLVQKVGLSRTTIWRLERAGSFPKRIQLSEKAVGYREADIDGWLSTRELVSAQPMHGDVRSDAAYSVPPVK